MFPLLIQIFPVNGPVAEAGNVLEDSVSSSAGKNGTAESIFAQLLALLCVPIVPITDKPEVTESVDGDGMVQGTGTETAAVSNDPIASPEIEIAALGDGKQQMAAGGDSALIPLLTPLFPVVTDSQILPLPPENFSGQAEAAAPVAHWSGRDLAVGTEFSVLPDTSRGVASQPPAETADLASKTAALKEGNRPLMIPPTVTEPIPVGEGEIHFSVRTENAFPLARTSSALTPDAMLAALHPDEKNVVQQEFVTSDAPLEHPVSFLFRKVEDTADTLDISSSQAVSGVSHIPVSNPGTEKPMPLPRDGAEVSVWSDPVQVTDLPKVLSALTIAAENSGEHRALLRLHPEHLGEVHAEITLRDGGCHVRLLPVLPAAHEALCTQADTLRDALTRQGMLAVTVEVSREGMGGGQGTGGQQRRWTEDPHSRPQSAGAIGNVRPERDLAFHGTIHAVGRGGLDVKV